jgi:hypothetical protein
MRHIGVARLRKDWHEGGVEMLLEESEVYRPILCVMIARRPSALP